MQSGQLTATPKVPPLRAVRVARGIGLREAAARARIDPAHLSRVERGQRQLSLAALRRLAGVLGLHELERHLALYEHGGEA